MGRYKREGVAIIKGKGGKNRDIPLNETARKVISRQPKKTKYVFDLPNRSASHIFRHTFMQMRKRTGVDFNLHLLRHCFTTKLLESGVDLKTIGSLLGHSRITISLIYSHTSLEKKKKAVEVLDTIANT